MGTVNKSEKGITADIHKIKRLYEKEDGLQLKHLMHIVLNSASNTGKKIQITGKKLHRFRRKFNNIWNPYGYMLKM